MSAITSQSDYQPISGSTQLLPRTTILALLFEEFMSAHFKKQRQKRKAFFAPLQRRGEAAKHRIFRAKKLPRAKPEERR